MKALRFLDLLNTVKKFWKQFLHLHTDVLQAASISLYHVRIRGFSSKDVLKSGEGPGFLLLLWPHSLVFTHRKISGAVQKRSQTHDFAWYDPNKAFIIKR